MKRNPSESSPVDPKQKSKSYRLANREQTQQNTQNTIKKKYAMDFILCDVVGDLSEYFSMIKLSTQVLLFLIRKETNTKITPFMKKDM